MEEGPSHTLFLFFVPAVVLLLVEGSPSRSLLLSVKMGNSDQLAHLFTFGTPNLVAALTS
jgi:hypothetical protein